MPVEGERSAATQATSGSSEMVSSAAEPAEVLDAVCPCPRLDPAQHGNFAGRGGDHQLLAAQMIDAALGQIRVEQIAAAAAEPRLQAARGIIEAGVDDLGIARTGFGADFARRFQHHDLAADDRQGAGDGEADDAGTDDGAFACLGHDLRTWRQRRAPVKRGWRSPDAPKLQLCPRA